MDRITRVAVQASLLRTAQDALNRCTALEEDDTQRAELTQAAATCAHIRHLRDQEHADLREARARVASSALEG